MRAVLLLFFFMTLLVPSVDATLIVNKYTNDFTLSSPNNEQLKVCACGLKTDTLIVVNVGNFYANYDVEILSDVDWASVTEPSFPPLQLTSVFAKLLANVVG